MAYIFQFFQEPVKDPLGTVFRQGSLHNTCSFHAVSFHITLSEAQRAKVSI